MQAEPCHPKREAEQSRTATAAHPAKAQPALGKWEVMSEVEDQSGE